MALQHSTGKERYEAWLKRQKERRNQADLAKIAALNRIAPVDLAYAAGIIDGEGCISISRRPNRATLRGTIAVAMCEPQAVAFLHHIFGGHLITARVQRRDKPEHRPQDVWGVAAKDAANVCRVLAPHLRVKRQQALNLIELQEINQQMRDETTDQRKARHQHSFGPAEKGVYEHDPLLMRRCQELCALQHQLNHRGNSHDATAQTARATNANTNSELPLPLVEPSKEATTELAS
jgi:hypothetical protein